MLGGSSVTKWAKERKAEIAASPEKMRKNVGESQDTGYSVSTQA